MLNFAVDRTFSVSRWMYFGTYFEEHLFLKLPVNVNSCLLIDIISSAFPIPPILWLFLLLRPLLEERPFAAGCDMIALIQRL